MNYSKPTYHKLNIAVMGSTNGSNLQPLQHAIINRGINASIKLVLTNKKSAGIIQQAQLLNIPLRIVSNQNMTRVRHEHYIHLALKKAHINLIILLGYMRIVSKFLINQWPNKIINVHPSLLPKYKGLMDLSVHQAVINSNDTISGCSVHYVTEKIDSGKILIQKKCTIPPKSTAIQLKKMIQPLEVMALSDCVAQLIKEPDHEFNT